jgi:hypothetical protein
VTPLAQNQLFVMNIVVNANVRKTLSDVDVTNVLQHFMVLDRMVAHVSFSRVFLIRQLWIVNYIKSSSNNVSK